MPNPQSVRRVLLALTSLIAMLGAQVATAHAEYGEVGSPIVETGKVSESSQRPHTFGVDPTDDSFYVADEVVQGETSFYRVQKFSASGTQLGEIQIKAKEASVDLGPLALEGIAVDPSGKHAYLLVDREREPEEEEPVFDPSMAAAGSLYAFSTEPESGKLKAAAGTKNEEGLLTELHSESKEPRVALLEPHGIAVDPTNGDVVIVGQEDMAEAAGLEPELRTAVERVHSNGPVGHRYLDLENCLDGANTLSGEAACEVEGQPFSPIVAPGTNGAAEGRVFAERSREIWEIPSSATEFKPAVKSASEAKTFETHPKRLLPTEAREELGAEQSLLEFPKAGEVFAELLGGAMAFAPSSTEGEGKIYLTAAITTPIEKGTTINAGALVLSYSEHAGAADAKELGWIGGQSESSGEKCSIPKKGNPNLLIGAGANENVFVFDAHEKLGGAGSPGVDIFDFGPGGAGCPHAGVTVPSVKVKNNQGEEVEVSPVPLGEPATLSSTISEGNAVKVHWEFTDLSTGEEETPEDAGYEFQTTGLKHKFEHAGEYEVTEIVETDDLASPTIQAKRKVTVGATPITLEFSYPATITAGSPTRFEAAVHDPHESGAPHLKYVWKFGDGAEKSGEATAGAFSEEHTYLAEGGQSVTLKVTDAHGVSAEVTHEISVAGATKEAHKEEPKTAPKEEPKGPPPSPPAEPAPVVTIASTSLGVNPTGSVAVQVKCPAGDSSCSGTVTLRTLGAVSARAAKRGKSRRKVVLTLASGSFTVAGGKTQTVTLHLSSKARTLLAHSHGLRAQLTITAHNAVGATHTMQTTVTLHAAVKSKRRYKR